MNASKERIDEKATKTLLKDYSRVVAARGKKIVEFKLKDADNDALMKAIIGPSGNLRAPSIARGKNLIVGFNEEMYDSELS